MKNLKVAVLLLAIIGGSFYLASLRERMVSQQQQGIRYAGLRVGEAAPSLEVTTIDGERLDLAGIEKPVFLIFSATWCPSCKETLDASKNVYPKYASNISFVSIGIDLSETKEDIENYRKSNGYPGEFAIGSRDIIVDYKVSSTSTKYGIRDGIVVYSGIGGIGEFEMESVLKWLARP